MLLAQPEKRFSDNDLGEMCDLYKRLIGHLDAFFSIARIRQYHLTGNMTNKAQRHMNCILHLWQFLGISVTPQVHLMEQHMIPIMQKLKRIGNVVQDPGKRAHQIGLRQDNQSRGFRNVAMRAKMQSHWENMAKDKAVEMQCMYAKEKSKYRIVVVSKLTRT